MGCQYLSHPGGNILYRGQLRFIINFAVLKLELEVWNIRMNVATIHVSQVSHVQFGSGKKSHG